MATLQKMQQNMDNNNLAHLEMSHLLIKVPISISVVYLIFQLMSIATVIIITIIQDSLDMWVLMENQINKTWLKTP